MKRSAFVALSVGLAMFIALLSWRGAGLIADTFVAAGWGIVAVALFHIVPLLFDSAALHVLRDRSTSFWATLGARWAGESVNSLMPAGQMGGPVVMARMLSTGAGALSQAGAIVTVATTQQVITQAAFAIVGVALLALRLHGSDSGSSSALMVPLLIGIACFAGAALALYRMQRRAMFGRVARWLGGTFIGKRHPSIVRGALKLDGMIGNLYGQAKAVRACFALNFIGWWVGIGEVWLALYFIGHPVSLLDALLLESLGQAIRGMAFAIPGALGVQEGGFLLLAPYVGLSPEAALALSLCKRARELLLGLPGLAYWHWAERVRRHRSLAPTLTPAAARPASVDG